MNREMNSQSDEATLYHNQVGGQGYAVALIVKRQA